LVTVDLKTDATKLIMVLFFWTMSEFPLIICWTEFLKLMRMEISNVLLTVKTRDLDFNLVHYQEVDT